jgi:hypothetical protein
MEQKQNNSSSGDARLLGLTFLVLLVLKLTVRQDLSWWWVTAPLWGPIAIIGAIGLVGYSGMLLYFAVREFVLRRRLKKRQDEWVRSMKGDKNE